MQIMRLIIEFAPAWVVAVASIIGLKTWKKQLSYKRKISIVDDIYAEVNHFLLKAHSIITTLNHLQIIIKNYDDTFKSDSHRQKNMLAGCTNL